MQEIPQNIRKIAEDIENRYGLSNLIPITKPEPRITKKMLHQIVQNPSLIAQYIDHTALKPTTTMPDIKQLCLEAQSYQFCSVCIPSSFIVDAQVYFAEKQNRFTPKICVVVGFPLGNTETQVKVAEIQRCIELGVDEIDFVVHIGWLLSKNYDAVLQEFKAIRNAAGNKIIKVILETCHLELEDIAAACILAKIAKIDFVKTSTGFGTDGADIIDVSLMHRLFGDVGEVKASGGIRTFDDALLFLQLGSTRLGCSRGVSIIKGQPLNNDYSY